MSARQHIPVGRVGVDDFHQRLHHALIVVFGGGLLQAAQLVFERVLLDGDGRRDEDLVVGGAGHAVALVIHQQFLVELFARAQTGDLDGNVHVRLVAIEADELLCQIHDAHRLAHVQHVDRARLRQRAGLQHQLRGLGDGHEVAGDVGVGQRDRAALTNLGLEQWDDAAVGAQHVAEAHGHALHFAVAGVGLEQHLGDALGCAHDVGGVDRLVRGELHEALHAVLATKL